MKLDGGRKGNARTLREKKAGSRAGPEPKQVRNEKAQYGGMSSPVA